MSKLADQGFVGYARVSLEEMSRGDTIEMHASKIRDYAEREGLRVSAIEEDPGFSGKKIDRPGFNRVRALMDRRATQGVILARLDRLTRDVGHWDMLLKTYFGYGRPFRLLSVSDHVDTHTANGRMTLGMRIQVFQWERETTVERTTEKLAHRAAKGLLVSRFPPYGFDRVLDQTERVRGVPRTSRLVPVPHELATLDLMLAMSGAGLGPWKIAANLNEMGIATRSGGRWIETTVRQILKRCRRYGRGADGA